MQSVSLQSTVVSQSSSWLLVQISPIGLGMQPQLGTLAQAGSKQSATPLQSLSAASEHCSFAPTKTLGFRSLQSGPPQASLTWPSLSASRSWLSQKPPTHRLTVQMSASSQSASITQPVLPPPPGLLPPPPRLLPPPPGLLPPPPGLLPPFSEPPLASERDPWPSGVRPQPATTPATTTPQPTTARKPPLFALLHIARLVMPSPGIQAWLDHRNARRSNFCTTPSRFKTPPTTRISIIARPYRAVVNGRVLRPHASVPLHTGV